ncbi:hypothetical protein HZB74_02740 [Candidatus Saccharibacteria bacterium]|nr:hypothetical protein [Candidatus Saccharibacteria bacterium]
MTNNGGVALISVFDKTGIEQFARDLSDMGWKIYASGGTASTIKKAGVKVTDITELSKGGEILGHRVVTLSREIYAGILADDSKKHSKELEDLGIPRIDLVCVDMYPLSTEVRDPKSTEESVIEKTDVGGPTLLHAAAKGRRIVLSRASQRPKVIEWLKAGQPDKDKYLKKLAAVAEYDVAEYMIDSANYLGDGEVTGLISERIAATTYGENPWQQGGGLFVSRHIEDPLGIGKFDLVQGKPLSYNNYTDVDRMLQSAAHVAAGFERNFKKVPPLALGAKHGNLCGAAVDDNPVKAIKKMLDGDQRAIFGGSIIVNFPITAEIAETIMTYKMEKGKRILDIVMAPEIDKEALEIVSRKNGKLRVFLNPVLRDLGENSIDKTQRVRHVRGGRLKQDNYTFVYDFNHPEIQWSGEKATEQQKRDMIMAWGIGSTSNSNTISIVKDGMLISNGVGQQDRVTSAELAIMRANNAGHELKGASAYSDSFFPFPDGAELLAKAGISGIIASRGSIRDNEVIEALKKYKVSFVTMPDSLSRGFFAH